MNGQMDLFSDNTFTVITGAKEEISDNELLKCFKSELKAVEYLSLEELFSGFNTIRAITFSYDIGFINEVMEHFDYGEVILGGNFLIQKDTKLNELLAEICTNAYEAGKAIRNHDKLVKMIDAGDIEFRTPMFVLDHRKIYLLKSDNGKTRVIKTSANMSKKAWNNDHMEHYEYDDSEECYEEYIKDFETAWSMSRAITMDVVSSKKADDLVTGNAILKGVKETGQTIILQQPESNMCFDNIKYTIDHEAIKEKYKVILEGVNPKTKTGLFEIIPKTIEKIEFNKRKLSQKEIKANNITEQYPALTFDLYNKECFLNGEPINTSPSDNEVRHDIDELIGIFNNFNQFISSDVEKLKRVHFKLMNAIFCSPFNAKLRCTYKILSKPVTSFPLFALISSETPNSGKSFMIKATLKMMTGRVLDPVMATNYKKDDVLIAQLGAKGTPFFIDEIDNKYMSTSLESIIKNPNYCEDNQIEDMPMLIFASNKVLKPDGVLRKRMVFFSVDADLPNNIDKVAYEGKGNAILKRLGTGFYREYLGRMLEKVKDELDFVIHSKNVPDEYYTDLMSISSKVIISIFEDYGYSLPSYVRNLTFTDDYSVDSNLDDIVLEIEEFCKNNKKACHFQKNFIIIETGKTTDIEKKMNSWKRMLPKEMKADFYPTKDCLRFIIGKREFESKLGHRIGGFSFFGRK